MAHASPAQPDPLLGTTINDRFKILSLIAKGGMGRVYRAEQAPLGRVVAVKVLHPNYSGEEDPEFSKRFTLEASVVSRLKHPNTVTVYDYGETADGVYYMAMELLEGKTLHRLLREEGALEAGRALRIATQIARSLREAHGQGVIHRDLKPANVFLITHDDDPDFVKVLDFGLVKNFEENDAESLTKTGLFMGSPKYMAPEQIRGDRCTPATDVYALGVMLFEMLAGKVPYDRPNSANLLLAHVNEPVPTLQSVNPLVSVPQVVEEVVYRCMAKTPEERYQSMDEFLAALKHAGVVVTSLGPVPTGEFHSSLSAPRAGPSGDHLRAAQPSNTFASASPEALRSASPSPPPLPSQRPVEPSRPQTSRGVVIAAAVASLCLVAVAAWTASRPSTPAPPAAPHTVTLVLESDPSGAEVLEHGTVIGRTPYRETWTGARATPSDSHTFTFRAPGHADAMVTLSGATLVHLARLAPLPQAPPQQVLALPDAAAATAPDAAAPRRVGVRPPPLRNVRGRPDAGGPAGYRLDPY